MLTQDYSGASGWLQAASTPLPAGLLHVVQDILPNTHDLCSMQAAYRA